MAYDYSKLLGRITEKYGTQAQFSGAMGMHRANEVRPVLKRVAAMAERTGCAVLLIGHMNKAQGLKAGYRGLFAAGDCRRRHTRIFFYP